MASIFQITTETHIRTFLVIRMESISECKQFTVFFYVFANVVVKGRKHQQTACTMQYSSLLRRQKNSLDCHYGSLRGLHDVGGCCTVIVCSNGCWWLFCVCVCACMPIIAPSTTSHFHVPSNSIKCNIYFLTFNHPSIHLFVGLLWVCVSWYIFKSGW